MNKKAECALVQDLLPSYLDGLTSGDTNEFIDRHLEQCEACYQLKRTMQHPLAPEEQARADMIEALRRDRRRRKRWRLALLLIPLAAALLFLPLPRRIDHSVTATLWTSGNPDAGSQTLPIRIQGTYYDYLFRSDSFEGTIVSPDRELFPGNAALEVTLDENGLITGADFASFLHIRGFMYAQRNMQDLFIGLYDENGGWSGRGGLVLTATAADREQAVQKTREIVEKAGYRWLMDSIWEGSPGYEAGMEWTDD